MNFVLFINIKKLSALGGGIVFQIPDNPSFEILTHVALGDI